MHIASYLALLGLGVAASAAQSSSVQSADHSSAHPVHSSLQSSTQSSARSPVSSSVQSTHSAVQSGNSSVVPSSVVHSSANTTLSVHATITANAAPGNGTNGTHASTDTASSKLPSQTAVKFTAHPDGQCQKSLGGKDTSFELDPSKGFPKFTTINKPSFPGAEAKEGSGWNVYWSIPKPAEGCRYQVMLPYQQFSGTPGYPGGNEIINVGTEGCFFGNIPTDSDVYLGYCCGSADCEKASLNSASLSSDPITRRDTTPLDSTGGRQAKTVRTNEVVVKPRGGSLASKSSQLHERFWYEPGPKAPTPHCKIIEPGQPYSRAGQQVVVGPSQVCESSPCSVSVGYTISYSTTATSSKTDTLTTSFGASLAIKAGVDFIAEADVTTTLSTEISNAIAETTGTDVMRGNSSTVTSNISLNLGNRGFITFTPTYKCVTGPLDCGNGTVGPIDFCQPDLTGTDGSPNGDFYAVVSD